MGRANEAHKLMTERKMSCAQVVFISFCKEPGLEEKLALSIAQGFGGGMGHTGGTCGAVTGAYIALGLAKKASPDNPRENIDKIYTFINEFNNRFRRLHGSLNCTELVGYDLSVPEKLAEARENNIFTIRCPEFVSDSVKIVESLLQLT